MPATSTAMTPRKTAFIAGLVCLVVYVRALSCGFVNFDDPEYVTGNPYIRHLDMDLLVRAFTHPLVVLWKPLTFISYAVDYRLWGLNPLGYHLTNILLHAANTALVVLIADRLCRDRFGGTETSPATRYLYPAMLLLAGLLFGIHPLRVESVAWISCRKDVLNGLFTFSSVLFYLRYAQTGEAPGEKRKRARPYLLSLCFFLLSLMSKPVSVVIPVMMLVGDWYPLGRLRKGNIWPVLAEKVPYFAFSAAVGILNLSLAIHKGGLSFSKLSLGDKLFFSGNALFEYLRLMLYPVQILTPYVLPHVIPYAFMVKTVAVIFLSLWVVRYREKKWLLATLLCFVISLLPVLSFFQVSASALAARYTYLPSVVPSIVAAAIMASCYTKCARLTNRSLRIAAVACLASVPVVHGILTERLIGVWRDSLSLWSDAIAKDPDNYVALGALGSMYRSAGKREDALRAFNRGLAANPSDSDILYAMGNLYTEMGELQKGGEALKRLVAIHPQHVMGWAALGNNYLKHEDYTEAEKAYKQALQLQPDAVQVFVLLGDLARIQRQTGRARGYYLQAEKQDDRDPLVAYDLACVEALAGESHAALVWLERAFQRGYDNYTNLREDRQLSALWGDARYNYLLLRFFPEQDKGE